VAACTEARRNARSGGIFILIAAAVGTIVVNGHNATDVKK
jgi:hypothetical protein